MKTKRFLALLLLACLLLSLVGCVEPQEIHKCTSACEECGGCLNASCTEPMCKTKCDCQQLGEHQCDSKCSECGLCTDHLCGEDTCQNKCQGHHACQSVCPTCGKCLDTVCPSPACSEKCPGHHECTSICAICGKCLDQTCREDACADKCHGHYVPAHVCESACTLCGKCTDQECTEDECLNKCTCRHANYAPHATEQMPRIDINSHSGSNEWATKYNRQDKIDGKVDYVDADVSVSNCDPDWALTDTLCEVKVRGNYTLDYPQKPIRLKFDKKQAMLGLNGGQKFKSWVLLADWKDLAKQNNATTFLLSKYILETDGYYASDYLPVEVYLNGQYWGIYLLVEQQQANEGRGDVVEAEDDYQGVDIGYYFEYDSYYNLEDVNKGGDYTFTMDYGGASIPTPNRGNVWPGNNGYTIKSEVTNPTAQTRFISSYMTNVFKLVYQATHKNTFYKFNADYTALEKTSAPADIAEYLNQYIDLQSFVDMYILQEIVCDMDISWSSFYMAVDFSAEGDKRLQLQSPWDKDSAFGITVRTGDNGALSDDKLWAANTANPWLSMFATKDWFNDLVKQKWQELKAMNMKEEVLAEITRTANMYVDEYAKHYNRWSGRLSGHGEVIWEINQMRTQKAAAEWHRDWLEARLDLLDSYWGK
ncbi:MAG: CotH kinase family protein [Clostridia bacterium]|nr:CotH kinase family protein [Clostridia bacterium]